MPIHPQIVEDRNGRPKKSGWLLTLIGLAAIFAVIAFAVQNGATDGVDHVILKAFRNALDSSQPLGPAWFQELARDVTALGSVTILATSTVAVIGALSVAGQHRLIVWIVVASGGAECLNAGLKAAFGRARPDIAHTTKVFTSSFPSGHALMSSAIALTMALALTSTPSRHAARYYWVSCAVILTALVGLSRIYLGLHFPSDVVAGWCVGCGWAIACWLFFPARKPVPSPHS